MDAGIAAVAAGAVGIIGALGGAFVGGRAAVTAAKVAGTGNRELARLQARRQAYADLGSAAFHFTTTADDVVVVFNRRFSGSTPTHVPVPEELYSQLDTRLDDVTHAAVMVQLEGPTEITNPGTPTPTATEQSGDCPSTECRWLPERHEPVKVSTRHWKTQGAPVARS
jgi:hypothetical protein